MDWWIDFSRVEQDRTIPPHWGTPERSTLYRQLHRKRNMDLMSIVIASTETVKGYQKTDDANFKMTCLSVASGNEYAYLKYDGLLDKEDLLKCW